MPLIDINFSILSNLDNLPDIYDNAMKKESPESLPVTILYWDYDICEKFLQKLNVNHTESQSIKKSTRKQRESKDGKNTEKTD